MVSVSLVDLEYNSGIQRLHESCPDRSRVSCSIEFGTGHSQSKIIRDWIGEIFDAHGIFAPWRGRFILITDELINNAIEHGSAEWDTDTCIIHAGKEEDGSFRIALEVHDTGNGKDSEKAKDMLSIREEHAVNGDEVYMEKRGRWLFHITEKLVDSLEFTESPRGGLAVKIEKNIPESEYSKGN